MKLKLPLYVYKLTYYFVGIVLFLGFMPRPAKAQSIVNEAYYDSITYQYYQLKNWQTLIDTGKWMRNQGLDYYYLRMRMGIACLELQKTAKAETHFRQALNFSPGDVMTHWQYSRLLAAQGKVADALAQARIATGLDPLSAQAWEILSRYQIALGDYPSARTSLERALEIVDAAARCGSGYLSSAVSRPRVFFWRVHVENRNPRRDQGFWRASVRRRVHAQEGQEQGGDPEENRLRGGRQQREP